MKRTIISMFVALLATVSVQAQQIAVVSGSTTTMYQTLAEAIGGATDGCTIYLPGGGFQIADDVKITKQVTIIGIGHKANSENADGNTVISGNLFFNEGSSGSAVMGCYISGDVNIGTDTEAENNIIIKYCNLKSIQVKNKACTGLIVNQCYVRTTPNFGGTNANVTNNILHSICDINGGVISNNIVLSSGEYRRGQYGLSGSYDLYSRAIIASNSTITNNIVCHKSPLHGNDCIASSNMVISNFGDECINIGSSTWGDVFINYNNGSVTPASDFHFKEAFQQYSNIGIYGGTGFSDSGMAPVPFIEAKSIPDKTDAAGMLKIKIRVKASE